MASLSATRPFPSNKLLTLRKPFSSCKHNTRYGPRATPPLSIRASSDPDKTSSQAGKIKDGLEASGITREAAREILKRWSDQVGHEITPEDLRRILVGQSTRAVVLVLVSTLLDAGAAFGAFTAGNFLGVATEQYGIPAVIGQALAYGLAGYYVAGAAFDFFKLGAVIVAAINYNVNSASFLAAIEALAGASATGLNVADKALDAANSIKVLQALNTMADMLRAEGGAEGNATSSGNMLLDLGAYLTLEKAQRQYGFEASNFGLTDAQAAEIATVFSKFDTSKSTIWLRLRNRFLLAK
jgi:alpha-D-ribose 1-methylphosphonate 5-triphosphate synthase subunit PhnG